jgi:hypothetical protein
MDTQTCKLQCVFYNNFNNYSASQSFKHFFTVLLWFGEVGFGIGMCRAVTMSLRSSRKQVSSQLVQVSSHRAKSQVSKSKSQVISQVSCRIQVNQ